MPPGTMLGFRELGGQGMTDNPTIAVERVGPLG